MARSTKRFKVAHDSTAAYAASQPLFDTLRAAVDSATQQRDHLSSARDTVQQTHVKLANAISDGDATRHACYIDHAVKAWRAATVSYADIFSALAKASAAEPSEGRAAREGHGSFVKMAAMASEARAAAESFTLYEEKGCKPAEPEVEAEDDEDSESAREKDGGSGPRSDRARINYQKRVGESRAKHQKKLLALRAKAKDKNKEAPKRPQPPGIPEPKVEYEDVSAQVEARIKAKQAKREAAKKEKKRKRESGDSLGADDRIADVSVLVPGKKRKQSTPAEASAEVDAIATRQKRQKQRRQADEEDQEGGMRMKRAGLNRPLI